MRSLISLGVCALAVCALAACGGGGGTKQPAEQVVRADGFAFRAPFAWRITRVTGAVSVAPSPTAPELIRVSVFPLLHLYRPGLFTRVVTEELDPHVHQLATQVNGTVRSSTNVTVAGIRSRQYELGYSSRAHGYLERITFVFRGKKEFELLCRWEASSSEPSACARLTTSFTPL